MEVSLSVCPSNKLLALSHLSYCCPASLTKPLRSPALATVFTTLATFLPKQVINLSLEYLFATLGLHSWAFLLELVPGTQLGTIDIRRMSLPRTIQVPSRLHGQVSSGPRRLLCESFTCLISDPSLAFSALNLKVPSPCRLPFSGLLSSVVCGRLESNKRKGVRILLALSSCFRQHCCVALPSSRLQPLPGSASYDFSPIWQPWLLGCSVCPSQGLAPCWCSSLDCPTIPVPFHFFQCLCNNFPVLNSSSWPLFLIGSCHIQPGMLCWRFWASCFTVVDRTPLEVFEEEMDMIKWKKWKEPLGRFT